MSTILWRVVSHYSNVVLIFVVVPLLVLVAVVFEVSCAIPLRM